MVLADILREPDVWALMCQRFPWVEEERGEIGEGLVHLEFAALLRGLERASEHHDSAGVRDILDFVESLIGKESTLHPEVVNAIYISFLEDLYLGGEGPRNLVFPLLPPKTRERWIEIADAQTRRSG